MILGKFTEVMKLGGEMRFGSKISLIKLEKLFLAKKL
jgi:hypothetical protein